MKSLHTRFNIVAKCARFVESPLLFLLLSCLLPSIALAQSTISGIVRDSSGAVVANATAEAGSDVLIERTRKVNTNAEGRYAIVDLRPGTYTVTVSSAGFVTVKQTIIVPANVTVPVDAELKVGSVAETVSVEARVATVDVENVAHPETLTRAEMDALPTGRYMQSIGSYVPGAHLNLPDIGGSQRDQKRIYYISLTGGLMAVDVKSGTSFESEAPRQLFNLVLSAPWGGGLHDGRLVFAQVTNGSGTPPAFTLVLNWMNKLGN